jgi:hypothetical protein
MPSYPASLVPNLAQGSDTKRRPTSKQLRCARAHHRRLKEDAEVSTRDLDTIEAELRLLAAVRQSIYEHGGEPSSRQRISNAAL